MPFILFDLQSGIAGDMIVAAALDLGVDAADFKRRLRGLSLDCEIQSGKAVKQGISATYFRVLYPPQKSHRHLKEINEIIEKADLPAQVRARSKEIFHRLAAAEAKIHNMPVDTVHFHEVGAVDAIIDVVGAALAFEMLGVNEFFVTPFPFGTGTVKCEHGVLAVPVPAVVELTLGFPSRRTPIEGELVTPTGAAVATALARPSAELAGEYTVKAAGYGAGSRDLPGVPNVLRLVLGERVQGAGERVIEIETQVDDATGEVIARATEKLFESGALDVFTTAVGMKKGRPGVLVTLLCAPGKREALSKILLTETGSIGLRISEKERICLPRKAGTVKTEWGEVHVKVIDFYGETRVTPEYESCKALAEKAGVPVRKIYEAVSAGKLKLN